MATPKVRAWLLGSILLLATSALAQTPPPGDAQAPAAGGAQVPPPTGETRTTVQSPAGEPAAPPTGAPGQPGRPQTADEAFTTRVKTLEEQVTDLKEKIYRSKNRLMMLQETVLGGDLSTGARAALFHKNEMGSSFVLESVAYALDGAPIFTKVDNNGDLDKREELEIFNGRIVPGEHQIAVRLVYRGHGYGIFSYLEGYKFKVQSSHTFNAEPGKIITLKIVGFEKGGLTSDLKDRPAVRYDENVVKDTTRPPPPAAGDARSAAPPTAGEQPVAPK